jgi:nucleoside-diphosphate-sugar epimerase
MMSIMSIVESQVGDLGVAQDCSYLFNLTTREPIVQEMRSIPSESVDDFDNDTIAKLLALTGRLLNIDGFSAVEEYDRYNGVADRGLELSTDELQERLAGQTILVSGGTGLIGSSLMKELTMFNPARIVSISRGEIEPVEVVEGVEYLNLDIRDKNAVLQTMESIKPSIVFHVAADKYNHEAESRAKHTLTTNIEGTASIIEAATSTGVKQLVYASTGKATRPYSPDVYASSKKTGEWLLASAAEKSDMLCSAVRFTHVVDHSNVRKKILERIDEGLPVKLQSPDVFFYIQSAKESAHLLLNSLLEARPNVLQVQAIRDLAMPINLLDIGLGAIAKTEAEVPIYFSGAEQGYEEKAWPGLYDPMTGGDVSPLINAIEADAVDESVNCPAVDTFPLEIATTPELMQKYEELRMAYKNTDHNGLLRTQNQALGWAMLDARLMRLPTEVLERQAARVQSIAATESLSPEHEQTGEAIRAALRARISRDSF